MKRSVAERFASIAEIGQFCFLTVDHGRMTYSISKPSELKGINIFGTLGSRAATEDVSMFAIEGPCSEVTIDKWRLKNSGDTPGFLRQTSTDAALLRFGCPAKGQ
jgi:hypothetical protein